jgi:hypothetical protein
MLGGMQSSDLTPEQQPMPVGLILLSIFNVLVGGTLAVIVGLTWGDGYFDLAIVALAMAQITLGVALWFQGPVAWGIVLGSQVITIAFEIAGVAFGVWLIFQPWGFIGTMILGIPALVLLIPSVAEFLYLREPIVRKRFHT